jgi:amino acid transporter
MSTAAAAGPLGQKRGVAFVIIIGIITLGIYWIYWAYKTQEEMKQHSGEGLGGVLGLVIWILLTIVTAFTIPSEVGNLYGNAGREKPLSGWTGLWMLLPFIGAIIWFVRVQGRLNDYWELAAGGVAAAPAVETSPEPEPEATPPGEPEPPESTPPAS